MSIQEAANKFIHGHTTVGTTAAQLIPQEYSIDPAKGVLIRTPGSSDPTPNANIVWVGNKNVTADSDVTSGGYPLAPGEAVFIPTKDYASIYVIAGGAGNDVAWMVI